MRTKYFAPTDFSALDSVVGLFTPDRGPLEKVANTVFGRSYEDMKPGKGKVGLHVIALGDHETYGFNRNFDGFPKEASRRLHPTFVSHAGIYTNHRNRDPSISQGKVAQSIFNEKMARIELFLNVDEKKASDHLHRLATTGELPVSMGIRVPFDVCSECNEKRAGARPPNGCDHLNQKLGQMLSNGNVVGMLNTEGKFHDISFVDRPADRIAWTLKAASAQPVTGYHLVDPGPTPRESDGYDLDFGDFAKIAGELYAANQWLSFALAVQPTDRDGYARLGYAKTAASVRLAPQEIDELRMLEPKVALSELADAGYVLSPAELGQYLYGHDVPHTWRASCKHAAFGLFRSPEYVLPAPELIRVFTVDSAKSANYPPTQPRRLSGPLQKRLADGGLLPGERSTRRVMNTNEATLVDKQAQSNSSTPADLQVMAGYQLGALHQIFSRHPGVDRASVCSQVVARNITS